MAKRRRRSSGISVEDKSGPSFISTGASWSPLSLPDINNIAQASFDILTKIGVSDAPEILISAIENNGGLIKKGRLLYPEGLLLDTIQNGPKNVLLAGQINNHDMQISTAKVYTGTGGASPNVFDASTQNYKPSCLNDLYSAARLADVLPHIQFFSRSLVARDIEDPKDFDLSTAVVSLLGTSKHVIVAASDAKHISDIANLCYEIAGSEEKFRKRPFLSIHANHITPPLRIHGETFHVIKTAVNSGIPVHCNIFGQVGASSPVTLAGSVAQTLAEVLAGMAFIHTISSEAPRIAGPRPMITDLRTGGMAGGAGEQAMATSMAVQVLQHWQLPCSVIAGATDSKLVDFQSGYEKALTIQSSFQAGANLITQAAGTQASLMGVGFGAMVADNDMLGAIQKANVIPQVDKNTLALDAIDEVVKGEGHFLGRPETYKRMRSDFLYPELADRSLLEDWKASDRLNMAEKAEERAQELLRIHWPNHGPAEFRKKYTEKYRLPRKLG